MLKISNITKDYVMKDQAVGALRGVSINFRRSEFVSILGPSGCGKTTLLNIIGGLDRYTSGDLMIDGVSTKEYKDKDWDNYRNHRVGFVFQNYNLIQHQSILENVELALTLSGIKKSERRQRAIEVLKKVGLGDKIKSKPNQLSGGQMQRVAIARALVNDPEIILADEPTGALDSRTSVQIMDLLKEVSKDRLVIMVTHNPELAQQYSSRIVKLLDGEITEDTMPYSDQEADAEIKQHQQVLAQQEAEEASQQPEDLQRHTFRKTKTKKSMSPLTALSLSFKNLLSKKGRTLMVSFAGSIGIIGIALVLAVSAGMTNYIDNLQSQSLASYPVSITSITVDTNSVLSAVMSSDSGSTSDSDNSITIYDATNSIMALANYNYMSAEFVDYVNDYYSNSSKMSTLNAYTISYATSMRYITTTTVDTETKYYPIDSTLSMTALSGSTSSLFYEGIDSQDYVLSMYDLVGDYPTSMNEVALVLDSSSVSLTTLESLGIDYTSTTEYGITTYSPVAYSDIIGKTYKLILNDGYFDTSTGKANLDFSSGISTDEADASYVYGTDIQNTLSSMYSDTTNTVELTVTAILILKDDASGSPYDEGVVYTPALAEYYHNNCINSSVVSTIRSTYLDSDGNGGYTFKSGSESTTFPQVYDLNISEMTTYFAAYEDKFRYSTPQDMYTTLTSIFGVSISMEEVVDLYLQMYGASNIPTAMYFYAKDFDSKDDIAAMLDAWNAKVGTAGNQIVYSDTSQILTSMLGTIIDIVSYVLIAFASISLVVSSIMIGIITYTSVIERTKEIGVLRSIGASKRDVSRVFNAETIIIGLSAGLIGVIFSALICIPISFLLQSLTSISGLAVVELGSSVALVVISMVLTFIAGLIPASIAAKKDPVQALRSE